MQPRCKQLLAAGDLDMKVALVRQCVGWGGLPLCQNSERVRYESVKYWETVRLAGGDSEHKGVAPDKAAVVHADGSGEVQEG